MKQRDVIFLMMAILIIVIVLLIVPPVCHCGPTYQSTAPGGVSSSTPTSTTPSSQAWLSPTSGPVGTVVTIHGSGFSLSSNSILMNGLVGASMRGIASVDGKTLTFAIPENLGSNCAPTQPCPQFLLLVMPSQYKVSLVSSGVTQDIGTFTVTGSNFISH